MSTETTTYDAMTEAVEVDDLAATLEELRMQDPGAPAIVTTTDDRRLRVEGMTAEQAIRALEGDIAHIQQEIERA